MSERTPVQLRRAQLLAEHSRVLTNVLAEYDVQQRELADASGRAPDKIQRVCDPNCKEVLSTVDMALAVEAGDALELAMLEVVRQVIGNRYAVSIVPARGRIEDDLRALGAVLEQAGELAAHFAGACADNRITADEAKLGVEHCDAVLRTVGSLRERLQHALSQRGDNVRRIQ